MSAADFQSATTRTKMPRLGAQRRHGLGEHAGSGAPALDEPAHDARPSKAVNDLVRLPGNFDSATFLRRIDDNDRLHGARVVLYDGFRMHVLRAGPPLCRADLFTVVVKPNIGDATLTSAPAAEARESRFYSELAGGVLGCGAAVVGWVVVAASGAAAPVSGGSSTFITTLAWGASVASSVQCANSAYRVYNEVTDPAENDWLDSQHWYQYTSTTLDVVSLAGAGAAGAATIKMALRLHRTTGKTMTEVLKGLSRQERRRIAEEVIRIENPGISNSMVKTMLRAGKYPKRFTQLQVSEAVRLQLKDALGASLSFTGSAMGGVVKGWTVGLAKSFETY